ncbi:MAG: hypothetical protein GYB66_07110 [Chloroflexi bacterium]|nr:hypothetical protein [Chloroflexota bacterium]
MWLVNQFSFVLAATMGFIVVALVAWRWRRPSRLIRIALPVLYLITVLLLGGLFRYPDSGIESVEEADARLTNGQPTFLMFYSNY